MNPYEAPQTVEPAAKETPPKRKLSWSQIALIALSVGVTQFVMHYFRAESREQKQAEETKQMFQQLRSQIQAEP